MRRCEVCSFHHINLSSLLFSSLFTLFLCFLLRSFSHSLSLQRRTASFLDCSLIDICSDQDLFSSMDHHQQPNQPFKSIIFPSLGGSSSNQGMDIDVNNIPPSFPTANNATHFNNHKQVIFPSSVYNSTSLEQGSVPMIADYTHNSQVAASSHPSLELSLGLPSYENLDGPNDRRRKLYLDSEMGSSNSSNKKPNIHDASNNGIVNNIEAEQLLYQGVLPTPIPHWGVPYSGVGPAPYLGHAGIPMMAMGSYNTPYHPNFVAPSFHYPGSFPQPTHSLVQLPYNPSYMPPLVHPYQVLVPLPPNSWVHNSVGDETANSTVATISDQDLEEILRKFRSFKQFDVVEDVSDHYFVDANSSMEHHSKDWAKRIQAEWKSLEKDLPDTIFVRVYESRIDLLRAVIIGAEGTPYHDGLFVFDVFFPSLYPQVPPQVYYYSGGLRMNPNLYNCGKVCLSLLNTWPGYEHEQWIPSVSTILQVLVSIQGLILVPKPYFNEPAYVHLQGSKNGDMLSWHYNEEIFLLSLKTMMYTMRRPPKNFKEFVVGHFHSRAHDILVACKAYMDGAQIGCVVKGGVQDVDQGDMSSSSEFKGSLPAVLDMLIKDFSQIGVKNCAEVLQSTTTGNSSAEMPTVPINFF